MSKSDRKLRDNTRKDYTKMVSSVHGDDEQEPGFSAHAASKNNNKNHNKDGDCGEIIDNEFFLSAEEDYSEVDSREVETSDDEISEARKELVKLKLKQKRESKRKTLEKIEKEKEEVRKSLERSARKGRKKSSDVNIKSLRKMSDVTEKVDKLMDRKLKLKCEKTSSDSSSHSSSSDSASSDSEPEERRKSRKEKEEKGRRGSLKSGKRKTVSSRVKYPQEWPNSHLNLHFVSRKKDYEELSMSEFCAGYSTILEFSKGIERKHRIAHLTELMYLSSKFTWKTVLNYHGACLTEIERGQLEWGDSFLALKSTILAGGTLLSQSGGSLNNRSQSATGAAGYGGQNKPESTLFCKNYQRGTCQQTRDHYGLFYGESRLLKHICATCWQKEGKLSRHPETADECPHKQ